MLSRLVLFYLAAFANAHHGHLRELPLDSSTYFAIKVDGENRTLVFGTNETHGCMINQELSCNKRISKHKICDYSLDLKGEKPVIDEVCIYWNPPAESH